MHAYVVHASTSSPLLTWNAVKHMLTFCADESDYNLIDEEVYFSPGVIEVNVTLAIIDDDIFEVNESVELHLTVPQTLQDVILVISDTAVVTINDNDGIVLYSPVECPSIIT